MFGKWKAKKGFFWKSWQILKRHTRWGGLIADVGEQFNIGQPKQ